MELEMDCLTSRRLLKKICSFKYQFCTKIWASIFQGWSLKFNHVCNMMAGQNHHAYYRLARLAGIFKIIAIYFWCCIYDIKLYICVGSFSFAKSQQVVAIESINQSGSPKKNICWYGTQKLPKNLYIYLRNYLKETV